MPAGVLIGTGADGSFVNPDLSASAPDGLNWTPGARGLLDEGGFDSGTLSVELPSEPSTYANAAGVTVGSFFDDYYNRLHLLPTRVNFGNISSDSQTTVSIWNAYLDEGVVLLEVTPPAGSGLVFDHATPVTFAPLQQRQFPLRASIQGSAVIDANVTFVFNDETLALPVIGNRMKAWGFAAAWPNTGQAPRTTYEFRTEIITSRNGREQRIALRSEPRRGISFQSHLSGEAFNRFKGLMWQWQGMAFAVPEWPFEVLTTTAVTAGQVLVPLYEVPGWIVPGVSLMVSMGDTYQLKQVVGVSGSTVELQSGFSQELPAGSKLYRSMTAYLGQDVAAPRLTNAVATVNVSFSALPGVDPQEPLPSAPQTFNGRELFLLRPNWADQVQITTREYFDELDYDRGQVFRGYPVPYGSVVQRSTYVGRTFQEAARIAQFFCRMRGRQGEFYMPTWEYDFQPKIPVSAAGSGLLVAGPSLFEQYGGSTVMKAIYVELASGELILRTVTSLTKVSDGAGGFDSLITIGGTWGQVFSAETVIKCGWLPVWRMSTDNLTVEWLTTQVAQIQLNMQTLEDLPV